MQERQKDSTDRAKLRGQKHLACEDDDDNYNQTDQSSTLTNPKRLPKPAAMLQLGLHQQGPENRV